VAFPGHDFNLFKIQPQEQVKEGSSDFADLFATLNGKFYNLHAQKI
jgi:hypothetical protein